MDQSRRRPGGAIADTPPRRGSVTYADTRAQTTPCTTPGRQDKSHRRITVAPPIQTHPTYRHPATPFPIPYALPYPNVSTFLSPLAQTSRRPRAAPPASMMPLTFAIHRRPMPRHPERRGRRYTQPRMTQRCDSPLRTTHGGAPTLSESLLAPRRERQVGWLHFVVGGDFDLDDVRAHLATVSGLWCEWKQRKQDAECRNPLHKVTSYWSVTRVAPRTRRRRATPPSGRAAP